MILVYGLTSLLIHAGENLEMACLMEGNFKFSLHVNCGLDGWGVYKEQFKTYNMYDNGRFLHKHGLALQKRERCHEFKNQQEI